MKADTVLKYVQEVSQSTLDHKTQNTWFVWGWFSCVGLQDESDAQSTGNQSVVAVFVHKPSAWAKL